MVIYNPKRKCPKCGCKEVASEYRDGEINLWGRSFKVLEEWIWRTCARCGHRWSEEPIKEVLE